jgi:hypothetical protein
MLKARLQEKSAAKKSADRTRCSSKNPKEGGSAVWTGKTFTSMRSSRGATFYLC